MKLSKDGKTLICVEDADIVDGTFIIPEGITQIEDGAFAHYKNLQNIVIPEGVTCIEDGAFAHYKNLQNIVIPEGVTCIGDNVFNDCEKPAEHCYSKLHH